MSTLYNKAVGLLFVCMATLATGCAIDTSDDEVTEELVDEERSIDGELSMPRTDLGDPSQFQQLAVPQSDEREQGDTLAVASTTNQDDDDDDDDDDGHDNPDPTPWNGNPDPTPWNSHDEDEDQGDGHGERENPDPTPWAATAVSAGDEEPDPQPWAR
jgi:hypothetical protein